MVTMTADQITTHPEYARAFLHYSQHGSTPENAGRLAYEYTQRHLALAPAPAAPPVRKPTSNAKVLLLIAAVIIGGIGLTALAALVVRSSNGAAGDVTVSSCNSTGGVDIFGALVSVKNSTDSSKDYMIRIELVDHSGSRVGEGSVVIDDVAPGQTYDKTLTGSQSSAGESCKVVDVNRY
jgi:hypothetical protein